MRFAAVHIRMCRNYCLWHLHLHFVVIQFIIVPPCVPIFPLLKWCRYQHCSRASCFARLLCLLKCIVLFRRLLNTVFDFLKPAKLDANEVPSSGSDNTDTAKTCTETSPPDRIVASYAAAAHAAALANHQPVSKAAEVFLAATSNTGRSRHPKRSRPHGTTGVLATHSDPAAKRMTSSCGVSSLLPTSTDSGSPNGVCLTNLSSDGWRRIVDRTSKKVVYIAWVETIWSILVFHNCLV